ncbi:cytochrome P450 4V2 [Caerostris extrusa]|uniref:Cytochrome P450 4V2 n=1 Tax=Caerostris extrusa TaxID=172846 RepID=A0AAV4Q3I4_CAEEX|nr:cytochrome P450 4V2 [Caerostris extrusa]
MKPLRLQLSGLLYLIGLYPDVQDKIHQELNSVLELTARVSFGRRSERTQIPGVRPKAPKEEDLKTQNFSGCERIIHCMARTRKQTQESEKLNLINATAECYRLYPPSPLFARKISEEISICGYKIPKKTTVVVSPFLVHRDENVFPDPEKFDPERFLPENSANIPECAYIPFAAGPRNCIGRVFAEMEVKVLVCHILRNFSFTLWTRGTKCFPLPKITLQSSQPARIKFRRRQQ